jgi:ankyrin repeat protein
MDNNLSKTLLEACQTKKKWNIVMDILNDDNSIIDLEYVNGGIPFTMLMCACMSKNINIVRKLLDRGARTEHRDCRGETALSYTNNLEIAKELIERGANVNAINYNGQTPLITVCSDFDDKTINYDLVNYLIESEVYLNVQNKFGFTAIMYAAEKENVRVMKLLFDNGADPWLENSEGKTFLDLIKTDYIRTEMKNYIEVPAPKPAKRN